MTNNLEELKGINRLALLGEIIDKTKRCGLIWNLIGPGRYKTTVSPYDFYLTKINGDTCILDVLKNNSTYRAYNSAIITEVAELFKVVDSLMSQADYIEKLKRTSQFVAQIPTCHSNVYPNTMSGGVILNSSTLEEQLRLTSLILLPNELTFGPTLFPWSGTVANIDDSPDASDHDGDTSYIRQQVSGALPTQWGFATIDFNLSPLTFSGPYTFNVQVANRREDQIGVTFVIDVL